MSSQLGRGLLTTDRHQTWVQTDRRAHEAWGRLVHESPRAAALLHVLVAHMDQSAAVVCSYAALASMSGMSHATVRRAVADLRAGRWVQTIQLGGKGGAQAYVVNSAVAWAAPRDQLPRAVFSARVVALVDEQNASDLEHVRLRRIPTLYPGEAQLPTGSRDDPPQQDPLPGMDPDPPALLPDHSALHHVQVKPKK